MLFSGFSNVGWRRLALAAALLAMIPVARLAAQDKPPAVEKSAETKKVRGVPHYVHTVRKGQTLYSIARAYGVTVELIAEANEAKVLEGLAEGQVILVPFPPAEGAASADTAEGTGNFLLHKVEKGQTLYFLSNRYGVSIDRIVLANGKLLKGGLRDGQVIRIPQGDGAPQDVKGDTLPSPVQPPADSARPQDRPYHVALMLPLHLGLPDSLEAAEQGAGGTEEESVPALSLAGLQFYEGVLLAVDSLSKRGARLSITVHDTRNDSNEVKSILREGRLRQADLIIGPFFDEGFRLVASYAATKGVDAVAPFAQELPEGMPGDHLVRAATSHEVHVEKTAAYIATRYTKRNIVVAWQDKAEGRMLAEVFRKAFYGSLPSGRDSAAVRIREVIYSKAGAEGIRSALSPGDTNAVVFLSGEYALVSDLMSKLNTTATKDKDMTILLFGMPNWKNFDNIDVEYFHSLRVHIPTSYHIDYGDGRVREFVRAFRDRFRTEPDKYAFQGYDMAMFFLDLLRRRGPHLCTALDGERYEGLQTSFLFGPAGAASGFVNRYAEIYLFAGFGLHRAAGYVFRMEGER